MIPFQISFRPGAPLCDQVVYAAKKAVVSGQMRTGDPFPSVRVLSKELKINPNTAHKVITQLVNEGVLEVQPIQGLDTAESLRQLLSFYGVTHTLVRSSSFEKET